MTNETCINFDNARAERIPSGGLEITTTFRREGWGIGGPTDADKILLDPGEAHRLAKFILQSIPKPT